MSDVHFSFEQYGDQPTFLERLYDIIRQSVSDFLDDPVGFIKDLLHPDRLTKERKRRLRVGLGTALFVYVSLFVFLSTRQKVLVELPSDQSQQVIVNLLTIGQEPLSAVKANKRAGGGGGGGREEKTPPSKGRLPQASLTPPIVAPDPHPPTVEHPSLPVVPTMQVDPRLVPKQPDNMELGLLKGIEGPPSSGPGKGGGMGSGSGGGVGSGDGTGLGPGHGFNTGGGDPSLGGGDGIGVLKPVVLSQPRPAYTEEARTNKIEGTVLLDAIFGLDGRIKNVHLVRGLGYGLDEKAIEAALQIKFRPATRRGQPIDWRQRIQVSFTIL